MVCGAAQDLTTDFGDGIKLIALVETISEETLGKFHKNPVRSFSHPIL